MVPCLAIMSHEGSIPRRKLLAMSLAAPLLGKPGRTTVEIRGKQFWVNGQPAYKGRKWEGHTIEGLLMNSRMIQGIYDDRNPETVVRWKYKDTGKWDANRNTREFIANMPLWRKYGLLSFVIGLQGGSPEGYSKAQPWHNTPFTPDGDLDPAYMGRLKKILDRADQLGMVPMVNYFYFGQDQRFTGAPAIRKATESATTWILKQGYRNITVDVVNEANNRSYDHDALRAANVHELVEQVKGIQHEGRRLLVSTSFNGNTLPTEKVVEASDFVLLHGNGVKDPARITQMIRQVRAMKSYREMPVVFNEDDHFDFDRPANNMRSAIAEYAGWGYFDPEGYQSPPVNWGLDTDRKRGFFQFLKQVTGS